MQKTNDTLLTIKVWLFPLVVTILSTVIWRDVTELKNDVKQLLAQSNVDKTRIDQLQNQVDMLNRKVFQDSRSVTTSNSKDQEFPQPAIYTKEYVWVEPKKRYQKTKFNTTL